MHAQKAERLGRALTSSVNPSTQGQSVTFSAAVTATSGTPTGAVRFMKGTTLLGTATLSGGMATFATSALLSGSNSIKASYGGTNYLASSASLTQIVK